MGACNDLKRHLTLCLRAEVQILYISPNLVQRKSNQRMNAERAAVRRERIEKVWKEIDENS